MVLAVPRGSERQVWRIDVPGREHTGGKACHRMGVAFLVTMTNIQQNTKYVIGPFIIWATQSKISMRYASQLRAMLDMNSDQELLSTVGR